MAALRSRRIEGLFGARLEDVTAAHVGTLVTNGVSEEFDLDFKQALYGRSDSTKRDLAGDVAALANSAGGVIVLGVVEDDQGRAVDCPGVELSDAERARMLQIVAAGVCPMPQLDIITVPLTSDDPTLAAQEEDHDGGADESTPVGLGFYLLAVPRSPAAPHAVLVNDALRFPKRNGATTRYLSEPEVSTAYRDRFNGATTRDRRIEVVERDAAARLDRDREPWVLVSLLPDLPGDMEITWATKDEFSRQTINRAAVDMFGWATFQRASVGRHRLLADGGHQGSASKYVSVDFHSDGAGAFAVQLPDLLERSRNQYSDEAEASQVVADDMIVMSVLSGLRRLAEHAQNRAAAGGNALVRVQLMPATGVSFGLEIGQDRGFAMHKSRSTVAWSEQSKAAETVASLDDLAKVGPALVAIVARLTDELAQDFGIPEMGQLTRNGEVRIQYWSRTNHDWLRTWGQSNQVAICEKTLDD